MQTIMLFISELQQAGILDFFSLTVAIAALVLTLYFQYWRRPNIKMRFGRKLSMHRTSDGRSGIGLSITIYNEGAKYGAINNMDGEIIKSEEEPRRIIWESFVESVDIGNYDDKFKPVEKFAGWADTIIIPGHSAVVKRIKFVSEEKFALCEGDYFINLFIYEGQENSRTLKAKAKFRVREVDEEQYQDTKPDEPGEPSKGSVAFNLQNLSIK